MRRLRCSAPGAKVRPSSPTRRWVPSDPRVLFGQCPPGKAASGAATTVDETAVSTNYKLFKYGSEYLDVMPDGNATGAPSAIELFARNAIQHVQEVRMATRCVDPAGLETIVQSASTTAGGAFSLFVPDCRTAIEFVGMTMAAGATSVFTLTHVWLDDGRVSTLPPYGEQGGARGTRARASSSTASIRDRPPRPAPGRTSACSCAASPPRCRSLPWWRSWSSTTRRSTTISSRRMRRRSPTSTAACTRGGRARASRSRRMPSAARATRDGGRCAAHTAIPRRDSTRTSIPQARRSASRRSRSSRMRGSSRPARCSRWSCRTLSSGACATSGVPIYRVWNNRVDSNHRYTTSIADRDAMVAKGYVKEGYGPNSVTPAARAALSRLLPLGRRPLARRARRPRRPARRAPRAP